MANDPRRVSTTESGFSPKEQAHTETLLARFGDKRHTFSEEDRAKSAAVRRQKATERREKAMSFPELARQRVESDPEKWLEPYEKARADGDWRAPEALMDRIYGRPAQASGSQNYTEIEPGDVVEIRRLLLESISVERQEDPAHQLSGEVLSPTKQS